jgi:nitroreductase
MIMELAEILRRRKMVRNYTGVPVDREAIERIVARGRKAPSGGFSQGLRLVVVTDPDTRRRIAELGDEPYYVERGMEPWISRAPVHVVVGMREDDYHDRYRQPDKLQPDGTEIDWPVPWWWVDAGKGIMLLLLAAVDEGLGAGLFGLFPAGRNDELRRLLGIPDDVAIVGVVTIGHPAPESRAGSRSRGWKPLDEVVRWERW